MAETKDNASLRAEALRHFDEGDFQHALELLSCVLTNDDKDSVANYNMGATLHTLGIIVLIVKHK